MHHFHTLVSHFVSTFWHQYILLKFGSIHLAESRLLESLPVAKNFHCIIWE